MNAHYPIGVHLKVDLIIQLNLMINWEKQRQTTKEVPVNFCIFAQSAYHLALFSIAAPNPQVTPEAYENTTSAQSTFSSKKQSPPHNSSSLPPPIVPSYWHLVVSSSHFLLLLLLLWKAER